MLQQKFLSLVLKYSSKQDLAEDLWKEIELAYNHQDRYFHTLSHLELMFAVLSPYQDSLDWDTLTFSVFYHDFAYDVISYVTDNNNEEKSAEKAAEALVQISFPPGKIEQCKLQILATKKHEFSSDTDTNFLIDADLAILGQPWNVYDSYRKNIRKEYNVYPDKIYHAGRQKVLQNFLRMERIYKTEPFHHQFEENARENITRELEIISLL